MKKNSRFLRLDLSILLKILKTLVTVKMCNFNSQKIFDFEFIYKFGSVFWVKKAKFNLSK